MRFFLALFLLALAPQLATAADPWIGKKVFLKETAIGRLGETIVARSEIPFPATVEEVDGSNLWVGNAWVAQDSVMLPPEALDFYTSKIKRRPDSAPAFYSRGCVWEAEGKYETAIEDYTEAIRIDLDFAMAYNNRGNSFHKKGNIDKALKDYSEAIRQDSTQAFFFFNRAGALNAKGDFEGTLKDYAEATRLDPKFAQAYNGMAWLKATAPDKRFRNGKESVELATKACELTAWADWNYVDTLAATYAEAGDFASAIKWKKKARELAPEKDKEAASANLDLYQNKKPFRQTPKK